MSLSSVYDLSHFLNEKGILIPLIAAICYRILVQIYQPSIQQSLKNKQNKKSKNTMEPTHTKIQWNPTTTLIFSHNIFLCIFSFICFLRTFPVVFHLITTYGINQGICMLKLEYGTGKTFGYWSYLFYLSKYYEMIDTFIVIYKGRRPIALQIYHHMGAVIGCGWFFIDRSVGTYIFMVPNSFIHTLMYGFYALSTIKIRVPLKYVITILQMMQFLFGMSCILYHLLVIYPYVGCMTENEYYISVYHLVYISWLFYKFLVFYLETYYEKKKRE